MSDGDEVTIAGRVFTLGAVYAPRRGTYSRKPRRLLRYEADSVLPGIAHRLYPALFRNDQAFTTTSSDVIYLMDDRVQEMIDIVREASGKEYIVFVIDEIGQYVGSYQTKILDLQGLAENLKNLGQGKVWIIGTAQQTLTEDDPRATINSPEAIRGSQRCFCASVPPSSRALATISGRVIRLPAAANDA